jgi:hypothetical protein
MLESIRARALKILFAGAKRRRERHFNKKPGFLKKPGFFDLNRLFLKAAIFVSKTSPRIPAWSTIEKNHTLR